MYTLYAVSVFIIFTAGGEGVRSVGAETCRFGRGGVQAHSRTDFPADFRGNKARSCICAQVHRQ